MSFRGNFIKLIKFNVFIVEQLFHQLLVDASSKDKARFVHSFSVNFLFHFNAKGLLESYIS